MSTIIQSPMESIRRSGERFGIKPPTMDEMIAAGALEDMHAEMRVRCEGAERELLALLQEHEARSGRPMHRLIEDMSPALLAEAHAIHHRWYPEGCDAWLAAKCHCASCIAHSRRGRSTVR